DKVLFGVIGVGRFGRIGDQVIANRVRVEGRQELRYGRTDSGALGGFLAADVHVFVGGHVVRQDHIAAANQDGGPDHRVEWDVVLADEVVLTTGRVLPPALPRLWFALYAFRPLDGRAQIPA